MKLNLKLDFELAHKKVEEWIYFSVIIVSIAVISASIAYVYYIW